MASALLAQPLFTARLRTAAVRPSSTRRAFVVRAAAAKVQVSLVVAGRVQGPGYRRRHRGRTPVCEGLAT